MRPLLPSLLLVLACGCKAADSTPTDTAPPEDTGEPILDADGDGYSPDSATEPDCDDTDPGVNPGVT